MACAKHALLVAQSAHVWQLLVLSHAPLDVELDALEALDALDALDDDDPPLDDEVDPPLDDDVDPPLDDEGPPFDDVDAPLDPLDDVEAPLDPFEPLDPLEDGLLGPEPPLPPPAPVGSMVEPSAHAKALIAGSASSEASATWRIVIERSMTFALPPPRVTRRQDKTR